MLTNFGEPRFYVRYPRWDRANSRVVFERFEATGKIGRWNFPRHAEGQTVLRLPARTGDALLPAGRFAGEARGDCRFFRGGGFGFSRCGGNLAFEVGVVR